MSKRKTGVDEAKATSRKKVSTRKVTKLSQLEAMLRRPEGATIDQISKALDWQTHSVRGAIAGSLKRKGVSVRSEQRESGPRLYRTV